jgi:hypothetical protein
VKVSMSPMWWSAGSTITVAFFTCSSLQPWRRRSSRTCSSASATQGAVLRGRGSGITLTLSSSGTAACTAGARAMLVTT